MRANVRRWYADPALAEVVFDLRHQATGPWPEETFALLDARLPGFDGRRERLWVGAPTARSGAAAGAGGAMEGTPADTPARVCRYDGDGARAVQYGPGVCSYNVLPPYGHFEDHLPGLSRLVAAYLDAAAPDRLEAAGQHYINVFSIGAGERPGDFFSFYPPLPRELQRRHTALVIEVEARDFAGGLATVTLRRAALGAQAVTYILEVRARSTEPLAADADAVLEWQQLAHMAVNEAFEMSITGECRKRLREL